jgi:hypothetical protein
VETTDPTTNTAIQLDQCYIVHFMASSRKKFGMPAVFPLTWIDIIYSRRLRQEESRLAWASKSEVEEYQEWDLRYEIPYVHATISILFTTGTKNAKVSFLAGSCVCAKLVRKLYSI